MEKELQTLKQWQSQGDHKRVVDHGLVTNKNDVDYGEICVTVAVSCLELNRPKAAMKMIKEAYADGPYPMASLKVISKVFCLNDKLDEGFKYYQDLLASGANMSIDLCEIGRRLFSQTRTELAERFYQHALLHDENCASAYIGLGHCAQINENFLAAQQFYQKAVALSQEKNSVLEGNLAFMQVATALKSSPAELSSPKAVETGDA